MTSFGVTRTSPAGRRTSGAIFDLPRLNSELEKLEQQASAPDFWSDQANAQKVLQRRRRIEEDRDLAQALQKHQDDVGVLVEWAEAGESVETDLRQALDVFQAAPASRPRTGRCRRAARPRAEARGRDSP